VVGNGRAIVDGWCLGSIAIDCQSRKYLGAELKELSVARRYSQKGQRVGARPEHTHHLLET